MFKPEFGTSDVSKSHLLCSLHMISNALEGKSVYLKFIVLLKLIGHNNISSVEKYQLGYMQYNLVLMAFVFP